MNVVLYIMRCCDIHARMSFVSAFHESYERRETATVFSKCIHSEELHVTLCLVDRKKQDFYFLPLCHFLMKFFISPFVQAHLH